MWVDLNSAFAMAEQQARPQLRGKPIGITNRISKECCIIAASYEAKARGVDVGTRRSDALSKCPDLFILESDPPKYHNSYKKVRRILERYSPHVEMRSIDEGVIDFRRSDISRTGKSMLEIGQEIKQHISRDIGDYTTVNIGIGPNRFLAKTAAGLNKPNGLDTIDQSNYLDVYDSLPLIKLNGIASRFEKRLKSNGIRTSLDFLNASEALLKKRVFKSVNGSYWFKRLRGYEVDDKPTKLGMIGRQWVVHSLYDEECLRSCYHFLNETVALKLRSRNVQARGVCVWCYFSDGTSFRVKDLSHPIQTNQEIWSRVSTLLDKKPRKPVKCIGIYLYKLVSPNGSQMNLFYDVDKYEILTAVADEINYKYGPFTIFSASALKGSENIKQKVPFGGTEYFDLLLSRA